MRIAVLLTVVLLAAACGRKPDVYIVTNGFVEPATAEAMPAN